jgi:hypothetical protein
VTRIRLATLLGTTVIDAQGATVGIVHDARFRADGPPLPSGRPSYRLTALVCGPASLGRRLGYGRGVHGPWPLDQVFRWLGRHSRIVDWEQIESWDEQGLHLRVAHEQLAPISSAQDLPNDDGAAGTGEGPAS